LVGRVLVLGGTGFIGTEVASAFQAVGVPVRSLARHAPVDPDTSVELMLGRAEDGAVLEAALEGVDWVVHALGSPPPAASTDDFDSTARSIFGLDVVLEALRQRPGVGLTFVSSGGAVYGNVSRQPVSEETRCRPISAYGLAKLMAEDSIAAYSARYGIPARVLRVSNAYGPRQNPSSGQGVIAALLRAASTGGVMPVYDGGRAVRDFVHVADVARAVVTLHPLLAEHQFVNVGSGTGHSVAQLLELVEELTETTLHIKWLPRRPSDVDAIVLDVSRLRQIMPWQPRDLETGIAQVRDAWSVGRLAADGAEVSAAQSELSA
jgi:UDP-glucose 4-epimerase